MQFRLLSLSHQRTTISDRENFALTPSETQTVLERAKADPSIQEILILSTCNRTEILLIGEEHAAMQALEILCKLKRQDLHQARELFLFMEKEDEILHYIFRVSAGLESQILGDAQIISQLKAAYQLSQSTATAGTFIHRLMQMVFCANKKISQETAFRNGISSASYAAVDMIEEYYSMIKNPRIAIIGFGDMGQKVCRHLMSKGHTELEIFNRSRGRVDHFNNKNRSKLRYRSLENLASSLADFDIIISTPTVESPLISAADSLLWKEPFKVIVDISIPRSVETAVSQTPGMVLYDMDDISKVTQSTMEQKSACIYQVEEILAIYQQEYLQWIAHNKNLGSVRLLKKALEQIKTEELSRFGKEIENQSSGYYETIMDSMIQKIIKKTVISLKSIPNEQERENFNSVIHQTFL